MRNSALHVSVGNLNIDIVMYVDRPPKLDESIIARDMLLSPGGAASNYAVAVSCYGHRVSLVASASTNPLIDDVLKELSARGVITDYVKRVEGEPGLVFAIVTPSGERVLFKYRGVNELLSPNDVPRELLEEASIIHIASIEPNIVDEIASRASRLGLLVSYDPGTYATTYRERIFKVLSKVNILFLNRVEARDLTRGNIELLLKHGVELVVIKKGSAGAFVVEHGGKYYHGVSKPIGKPVNTTGAGDAFDAFFNAAYLDYRDPGKALAYGLACGAYKTLFKTSIIECRKQLFNKQLNSTIVEVAKKPENWVLED